MLYISRYIASKSSKLLLGVADTDDGSETVVAPHVLSEAIAKGIEICGVDAVGRNKLSIRPYQDMQYATPLQLSYKERFGIDITLYKTCITGISFFSEYIDEPVRVRLSDFGDCCADLILNGCNTLGRVSWLPEYTKIILVFDDKICGMTKFTLCNKKVTEFMPLSGVVYDLREVHNDKLVNAVYSTVRAQRGTIDAIIDSKARKLKMKLLGYV